MLTSGLPKTKDKTTSRLIKIFKIKVDLTVCFSFRSTCSNLVAL